MRLAAGLAALLAVVSAALSVWAYRVRVDEVNGQPGPSVAGWALAAALAAAVIVVVLGVVAAVRRTRLLVAMCAGLAPVVAVAIVVAL